MSSSPSEPCSLSLQLVSFRLESPRTSSQHVSVALPRQLLYVVLCVLGYTASLSLLCDLFKIDSLKLDDLLSVICRCPSATAILLADGMRFLSHESEDVVTNLLVFSFLSRRIPSRTTRAARCPAFFVVCNLFLSVSNLSCRLFDNLPDLNLHFRNPSLQSTWFLHRSVAVSCPF